MVPGLMPQPTAPAWASKRLPHILTPSPTFQRERQCGASSPTTWFGVIGGLANDKITVDGPVTVDTAERIAVDLCFFSADGFNDEQLENQYLTGALTKKIIIQRSVRNVFVSDSNKYEKSGCFRFCGWDAVNIFLTDSALPKAAREAIGEKSVDIRFI
jgi:Transcriptional regulators of sugar metabolism